jgi:hypothetical protein
MLAEREGFGLSAVLWIQQLTESKLPGLPGMPALPWSLALFCPLKAPVADEHAIALLQVTEPRAFQREIDIRASVAILESVAV